MTNLNILSGGAAQGLVKSLAETFKARTGLDIDGEFGPLTETAIVQLLSRFLNSQESNTILSAVKILLSKV